MDLIRALVSYSKISYFQTIRSSHRNGFKDFIEKGVSGLDRDNDFLNLVFFLFRSPTIQHIRLDRIVFVGNVSSRWEVLEFDVV